MLPYQHQLLIDGPYRIVALTPAPDHDPDAILAYAVIDAAGSPLCREATFADARAWLQARRDHDALTQAPRARRR